MTERRVEVTRKEGGWWTMPWTAWLHENEAVVAVGIGFTREGALGDLESRKRRREQPEPQIIYREEVSVERVEGPKPTSYLVEVYKDNFIDLHYEEGDVYVKIGRHAWGWMIARFYGEDEVYRGPTIYSQNKRGFDTSEEALAEGMKHVKELREE